MNRLAKETSPYLLQHQHNPVDWYPWGSEAFEAARSQNKPIFVSVGYSTCYWCHVMERQSFENESIAAVMNEHFINIKVDREERPDVDQLYMTAVQILTQQGGWPMSVWLTPDLKPFYGGTYFPPEDGHGRPGFRRLLEGIADAFKTRRDEVERSASEIPNVLGRVSKLVPPTKPITIDTAWVDSQVARSVSDYDQKFGGFGRAPKFPRQTQIELLLAWLDSSPTDLNQASRIKQMITHSLDAMALGGLRDQLGGGFHRYSTDAKWLVPHFEIMLYDQAMLGFCYVEAFRQFGEKRYEKVARELLDFVLRKMTSPEGAFYTAFDAEVDSQEGLNYLWTFEEVRRTLTDEPNKGMGAPFSNDDAELFARVFGLDQGPNFTDPHHSDGGPEKNILFIADANAADANEAILDRMRSYLLEEREKRKQPLLDTKILASWNALMIRAFANAGMVLKEPRYIEAAERAAKEITRNYRDASHGIIHTKRPGAVIDGYSLGFLDDYAFLAEACLALFAATRNARWRDEAQAIATRMIDRFGDETEGGYFFTEAKAGDLMVRQKVGSDSPLPSGNAVAARVLLALGATDAEKLPMCRNVLTAFGQQADAHGEGMSAMILSALTIVQQTSPIAITAVTPSAATQKPKSPEDTAADVVALSARWDGPTSLVLVLEIAAGYHLNAHPAADGLVPTEVSIDGAVVKTVGYPPGKEVKFTFAEDAIPVYETAVELPIEFTDEPTGRLTISLVYQACTDAACLPPVRKVATFEIS